MHKYDTLFLDRDGVINKKLEGRYVRNFSEFEFINGASNAISRLSNVFNRILIITNQQGIAKGIMSEADLTALHVKMIDKIKYSGGHIDKIYFCPHLAELNCICRKPKTGMIENAIKDYPMIVIEDSFLIGDSDTDIEAGFRMGLKTFKVSNNFTLAKWTDSLLS